MQKQFYNQQVRCVETKLLNKSHFKSHMSYFPNIVNSSFLQSHSQKKFYNTSKILSYKTMDENKILGEACLRNQNKI